MRYEIPAMLEAGGGAIVDTASVLGAVGFPASACYPMDGGYLAR